MKVFTFHVSETETFKYGKNGSITWKFDFGVPLLEERKACKSHLVCVIAERWT
jgi:hypothetical protein